MLWLLAAIAWADEVAEEADTEIVVIGEREVEAARLAVLGTVDDLGYTKGKDRGDRMVLRDPDAHWRGKVLVWDDGRLSTRRTGPSGKKMAPIKGTRIRPYPLCIVMPTACVAFGSAFMSDAKWQAIENDVVDATNDGVATWNEKIADRELAERLAAVPDRLAATWERGEPLVGDHPLASWPERRAEILAFWESRTETRWGEEVREAVERFVRAVVQTSEHPFEPGEIEAFNLRTSAARPFRAAGAPAVPSE
jgi:hypothetical protein